MLPKWKHFANARIGNAHDALYKYHGDARMITFSGIYHLAKNNIEIMHPVGTHNHMCTFSLRSWVLGEWCMSTDVANQCIYAARIHWFLFLCGLLLLVSKYVSLTFISLSYEFIIFHDFFIFFVWLMHSMLHLQSNGAYTLDWIGGPHTTRTTGWLCRVWLYDSMTVWHEIWRCRWRQ